MAGHGLGMVRRAAVAALGLAAMAGAALAQQAPRPPVPPAPPAPPPAPGQTAPAPAPSPAPAPGAQRMNSDAAAQSVILSQTGRSSRAERGLVAGRPPELRGDEEKDWTVMLGAGVLVRPAFVGSDVYKVSPIPAASITYKDIFFADPARGVGLRSNFIPGATVSVGADYNFGRKEKDDSRLIGLGDLEGGPSAFAEVEFRPLPGILQALSLSVGIEAPLTGDIDGYEAGADLGVAIPIGAGGYASFTGGVLVASEEMMQDLFGVTPAQSARSIFPVYTPDGGIRAATFGVTAFRPVIGDWNILLTAGYDRLVNDAEDSPITVDVDQYRMGAGLVYEF